jgi:glutamate-1-semialdehyde 2,1-aminomutase
VAAPSASLARAGRRAARAAAAPATTALNTKRSEEIFAEAQNLLPGGVNSPVRAFKSVGGQPIIFDRVEGAHCVDVDGNRYIDYVREWGRGGGGRGEEGARELVPQLAAPMPLLPFPPPPQIGSWGPAIVGHAHPEVTAALTAQLAKGTSFGAPCELENVLAKAVIARVPCVEMVGAGGWGGWGGGAAA